MKLTIVLDKKSRFSVELLEVEAKQTYENLVKSVVSELGIQVSSKELIPQLTEDKDINKPTQVKQSEIIKRYELQENDNCYSKKIVMVRCTSCNNIAVPLLTVKDGELVFKNKPLNCKQCQKDIPIGDLKPARYQCPNCNTTASFYVMNDLNEANCKVCGSLIDLTWNDKKQEYVSINLIR